MHVLVTGARALICGASLAALAACGGGGGGDGSSSGGGSGGSGGSSGGYVLFVSDESVGSIAAFKTLDPAPGQPLQAQILHDAQGVPYISYYSSAAHVVKKSEGGVSIAYDAVHDDLYVVHFLFADVNGPAAIDVFAHASAMADEAAPARTILVSGFFNQSIFQIALDTSRDQLWIGGYDTAGRIVVLDNASTLNGNVTPARDITGLPNFSTFAHDRVHDLLYLEGGGGLDVGVKVFGGASTLVSNAPVTRTIDLHGDGYVGTQRIALDEQRDIVYVPDALGKLFVVHGASAAAQSVVVVPIPDEIPAEAASVDAANDRLYLTTQAGAYMIDNASMLTSNSVLPTPAVLGSATIWSFAFP